MFAPEERAHITQDRSQSFSISCESHSQAGSHWRRRLLANYAVDEIYDWSEDRSDFDSQSVFAPRCIFQNNYAVHEIYDWSEDHADFDSQSVFAPRCIFQNKLTSVPGLRTS